MRAFAVSINGKPLCTAGIGDDGVLSSNISWSGGPASNHLHMHVGGLDSRSGEHKGWAVPVIAVGDEITTRVVETDEVDAPVRSTSGDEVVRKRPPRPSFAAIDAGLILKDPATSRWEDQGRREFAALPRIGEWLETEIEGVGTMIRIVMVAYRGESGGEVELYAVVEGKTVDCLKRLLESG